MAMVRFGCCLGVVRFKRFRFSVPTVPLAKQGLLYLSALVKTFATLENADLPSGRSPPDLHSLFNVSFLSHAGTNLKLDHSWKTQEC